jgi:RNA polymerase sigma factor (sigma-70 family)
VQRYSPIVLGVCRRVLRHEQDAEDAFQATFLVLFRQAGSIRKRQSVGSWLYGVAYRIAQKARVKKGRRSMREAPLSETPGAESTPAWIWQEVRALLDDEVNRLPAKYRLPFVLCHVEGKTNAQAAEQIGCPLGTVLSRLAWARERLRSRLTRRGLTFPVGLVTTVLAEQAVAAEIPARLANATVQAAVMFGSGQTATPVKGMTLAQGFIRAQFLRKWTKAVGLLAVAGLVAVFLLFWTWVQKPKTDQELLQGTWKVTKMWFGGREGLKEDIDMIFAGNQFTQRAVRSTFQASFRLDPGKDPKEIDFLFARRVTWRGIYRLEGDHLLLCWNTNGRKRPADFTGEDFYYYELRRPPQGPR